MKKVFILFILLYGIAGSTAGQSKFLNTIKKGIESTTGLKVSDETLFVYPVIGEWKMQIESCEGDNASGEVVLKIKVTKITGNRIMNERCLLSEAVVTGGKESFKLKSFSADPLYSFEPGKSVNVTFQPILGVPDSVRSIDVKFYIQMPSIKDKCFEIRRVPVDWKTATVLNPGGKELPPTVITEQIPGKEYTIYELKDSTITSTIEIPGSVEKIKTVVPGRTETSITAGGYDIKNLRTYFFQFKNPNDELEAVDTELFDESQFVYSLSVGLKNQRFPVEKAYANFGNVEEDKPVKDYYMKHRAKCFVLAEKGKTPMTDRDNIAANYLYLAINKFVNDNADNGLFYGSQRIIPRTKLVESLFGINLNINREILKELDDGAEYMLEYISNHPAKKSTMKFMGDDEATRYSFEYKFYDMELAFFAFFFSPVTLHYEIRSWYDKVNDVTVYAYFYCVGYDHSGMKQTIGEKNYDSTKADFKKNNNLDFDLYPLECLMMNFEDKFTLLPNPPKVEEIYFPGHVSWFTKKTPPEKKTVEKKVSVPVEVIKKEPEKYAVSAKSGGRIMLNVLDISEDEHYTYLAANASGISKLIAVEKSSGKFTVVYKSEGNRGDVKRLMKDHEGKVLVEFSDYPIMTCYDAKLEDTKLGFFDNWKVFMYSKLKAVMPNGDVLMVRQGTENILADRNGVIKFSSKELYYGELPGKVAVTKQGVIWEPGQRSYVQIEGLGTTSQPVFGKLDTGYDSQFKGSVNEIKIAPNGDIFIASGYGLHKSSDNGKIWQSVKCPYAYGNFGRIAINQSSEIWAATSESITKYDNKLGNVLFKTSEFDILGEDGKNVKLQTTPRILFSDSANNLWIIGGTYNTGVIIFNPNGIAGYTEIAGKTQTIE